MPDLPQSYIVVTSFDELGEGPATKVGANLGKIGLSFHASLALQNSTIFSPSAANSVANSEVPPCRSAQRVWRHWALLISEVPFPGKSWRFSKVTLVLT